LVNKADKLLMQKKTDTTPEAPAPQKKWWKGKLAWMKNKYLLAGAFFLVWMLFFDPKDISSGVNRWRKYKELQASEQKLVKQIENTRTELGQLKSNAQTIEKYAREKYWMKKDNEDLFIVEHPVENK
jgi:cell division protein DivIC